MKETSKLVFVSAVSSLITIVLVSAVWVFADSNVHTTSVPYLIPYKGVLEKDGQPFNGTVDITFNIYDSDNTDSPVWSETQSVTVYNGKFSVLLGSTSDESSQNLKSVVDAADRLYLEIAINGNVLSNRQEIVPVPYALWSKGSTDFVANGHSMIFNGYDFVMGPTDDERRGDGGRALVHMFDDTLYINYNSDFSGGVKIDSNAIVQGTLRLNSSLNVQNDADIGNNLSVGGSISLGGISNAIKAEDTGDGGHVLALKGMGGGHVRIDDTDLMFGPHSERGDGGRALVHGNNDKLIINFGRTDDGDFSGGVEIRGNVTIKKNLHVNGTFSTSRSSCRDTNCSGVERIDVAGGTGWGDWRGITFCPAGKYVCGIEQRVENSQGDDDDTAVNDIAIVCCPF